MTYDHAVLNQHIRKLRLLYENATNDKNRLEIWDKLQKLYEKRRKPVGEYNAVIYRIERNKC